MRKAKMILVGIACVVAATVALFGCANAAEQGKKNFAGTWELESMKSNGQTFSAEDIAKLKEAGLSIYLTLTEDGNAQLSMYGTPVTAKWTATDATNAKLTLDNAAQGTGGNGMASEQSMKLEGDKLVMEAANSSITMKKSDGAPQQQPAAASASSANSASSSASASSSSAPASSSQSAAAQNSTQESSSSSGEETTNESSASAAKDEQTGESE